MGKSGASRLMRVALVALTVAAALPANASDVIIRTSALHRTLSGSKFRHVGAFNAALKTALLGCGATVPSEVTARPGALSTASAVAIRRLRACSGWNLDGEAGSGDITEALWRKLLPDMPVPDAFARMFIATLTLEGTDYDRLEWNYSQSDPTAWATWGPYGATLGQSAEIQKILDAVESASPGVVENAFRRAAQDTTDIREQPSQAGRAQYCPASTRDPADDYALFKAILPLRNEAAGRAMRVAFCDDRRFATWVRAFRILGEQPLVRRAYDAYYLGEGSKVARYLATTRRGYAAAGAAATEIDLAMGMDGQTQLSSRADADALSKAIKALGPQATPVDRRVAISEALPASARNRRDRCGRDQVFIHDNVQTTTSQPVCTGVTARKGRPPEPWDANVAWRTRGVFTAEDVGLRDVNSGNVAAAWNFDFDPSAAPQR